MKFALIGTGVIGRLRAQTIVDNPSTHLVGVADVDRVSATRLATSLHTKAFGDYRQLLDDLRPDAVIVSSPVTLHEEMCCHAFERGCHVLVEKPLANSLDACERILRASHRAGRALAVGFNHRFYPAVQFLTEALAGERIGAIDHFRVFGGHDGLHNFRADWMFKGSISGGGCMMDVGIHMTDLARYVGGEIDEVYGVATGTVWQVEGSEDNAMAIMKTRSGKAVIYQSTWDEWRGFSWYVDVYGDRGMLRAAYAPMFNLLITQDTPGGKRSTIRKRYPELILREKLRGWQSTTQATFDHELREFLRFIGGEKDAQVADGWAGLRANQIAQAVYQSTAEGRPIRLPARGET